MPALCEHDGHINGTRSLSGIAGKDRCRAYYEWSDHARRAPRHSGVSFAYILRGGEQMDMNRRAGDMIPVNDVPPGPRDDLDRWARKQARLAR